jgi:hypothetical protein
VVDSFGGKRIGRIRISRSSRVHRVYFM